MSSYDSVIQQIIDGACIAGAIAYSALILSALFNLIGA